MRDRAGAWVVSPGGRTGARGTGAKRRMPALAPKDGCRAAARRAAVLINVKEI